jgi:hypothetical protein
MSSGLHIWNAGFCMGILFAGGWLAARCLTRIDERSRARREAERSPTRDTVAGYSAAAVRV